MPEGKRSESEPDATAETGNTHRHHRKRHSHRKGWEYKRGNAKTIRTVIIIALAVLAILFVWYTLISTSI